MHDSTKRKVFNGIAVTMLISLLFVLAACSGAQPSGSSTGAEPPQQSGAGPTDGSNGEETSKPGPVPSAPEKKAPVHFRHGVNSFKGDAGFALIGVEKGFFAEEGIEHEFIQNESNVVLLKALISGDIDIAEISPGGMINAVQNGAKLKIVGGTLVGLPHVLYAKKEITTAKDLEGKAVGVSQPGSLPDELVTMWMIKNGADPSKIQRVPAGGSAARVQAVLTGKIDAAASSNDWVPQVEADPNFHVPVRFYEELTDYMRFALLTTDQVIQEKPEALYGFLKAYSRGLRYAVENRDEVIAVTAKQLQLPLDDPSIHFVYDTQVNERLVHPDLSVTPEQVDFMQESLIAMGTLDKPVPTEEVLDLSFQKRVVEELGEWKW